MKYADINFAEPKRRWFSVGPLLANQSGPASILAGIFIIATVVVFVFFEADLISTQHRIDAIEMQTQMLQKTVVAEDATAKTISKKLATLAAYQDSTTANGAEAQRIADLLTKFSRQASISSLIVHDPSTNAISISGRALTTGASDQAYATVNDVTTFHVKPEGKIWSYYIGTDEQAQGRN